MLPNCRLPALLSAATLAAVAVPSAARAELLSYYVGIDDRTTIPAGSPYSGLANPNFNHLSLLFAHTYDATPASNHYHSKGIFVYTGPNLGANTAIITSPSDYAPEGALRPITLTLGSGVYDSKLASNPYTDPTSPEYHFSFLELGSTQSLAPFTTGSGEHFLFNSGGGRWDTAFTGADLHFELVSLTPGLRLGGLGSLDIGLNQPGDDFHLADGLENNDFSFTPVLWTEANAVPGTYEAAFRLVDENGVFGDSGVVRLRTEVVPEPGAGLLTLVLGGVGALFARWRQRRAAGVPARG